MPSSSSRRARLDRAQLREGALCEQLAVADRAERELVGDERVHPVDGHELLRERVGRRRDGRSASPGCRSARRTSEPSETPGQSARPASPYQLAFMPRIGRRVGDDRGRPLDGVDLRHQRGVDEPRACRTARRPTRSGTRRAARSQIALCSSMKSVCRSAEPDPEVARRRR